MKGKLIIDEVELGNVDGNIEPIALKGRVVSKNKIRDLDEMCYNQILIDLGIDKL